MAVIVEIEYVDTNPWNRFSQGFLIQRIGTDPRPIRHGEDRQANKIQSTGLGPMLAGKGRWAKSSSSRSLFGQVTRKSSESAPFLNENQQIIEDGAIQSRLYPSLNIEREVISVSGCGDCLAAGMITGILRGWKEYNCVLLGLHAAKESIMSFDTVPDTLKQLPDHEKFYEELKSLLSVQRF